MSYSVKWFRWSIFTFIVTGLFIISIMVQPALSLAQAQAPISTPDKLQAGYNMEQLETAIEEWINLLAKEDGFESWQHMSTWSITPLGPGTHGWVVIVKSGAEELGHLIIHASPDGMLHLTEYGTGTSPLYSIHTLYQTLIQQELIPTAYTVDQFKQLILPHCTPVYYSPMETFWLVQLEQETFIIDANTGEWYAEWGEQDVHRLDRERSIDPMLNELLFPTTHIYDIKETHTKKSFDVYEQLPWLSQHAADIDNALQFERWFKTQPDLVTYTAEIFEGDVMVPFPVVGIMTWHNTEAAYLFIELDHEGSRFVPYDWIQLKGSFYEHSKPTYVL